MSKQIVLTFDDTEEMREVLMQLGVHCHDDNVPFAEDAGKPDLAAAYESFNDVVTRVLHPESMCF